MPKALSRLSFVIMYHVTSFPLYRHLYEESALAQAEAKLAAGGAAAYAAKLKLKNEDAVIAAVLAALGLEVQCVRLLQMEYLEED